MKKYLFILITLILLAIPSSVLASDITDALFYGIITISNNGTTASEVSVNLSLDSQSLIDVYGIDTAFDYVAVRNSAGTDVPFQPSINSSYPWYFWVPSIASNANLNYIIYTGQSDFGATKYYFPGNGGMSVNDDATLELGDNFSISLSARVDTTLGDNNTIISKYNSFRTFRSDDNEITSGISLADYPSVVSYSAGNQTTLGTSHILTLPSGVEYNDLLLAFFVTGLDTTITFSGGWTQLFQTSGTAIKFGAWYRVADGTEGGTITVTTVDSVASAYTIYRITDYYGNPVAGTSATGSSANPNPPNLVTGWGAGKVLWFAASGNDHVDAVTAYPANYSNGINDYANTGTGCGVGTARRELEAASEDPGTFTLAGIEEWVTNTVAVAGELRVTATGVPSGERLIVTSANVTDFTIDIDSGTYTDTVSLGGASVPDNAAVWQIGNDSSTPYIFTANVTVDGTLKGSWEWEYATTFTDLSGNGNDATPTFRTTSSDPDVTAELSSFEPINTAIPPAFTVEDAPDFITGNITTSSQFTTGNVSTTGGPPGFRLVNDLANQGNTPNIWAFGIIALCLVSAGQLFWVWMQKRYNFRSMWPMFATGLLIMGLFVALGGTVKIFDVWMVIFYIIIFICLMVMSRHTEVGGYVSTHGMIGFCAQSWIGLTLINKMLEGTFIGATETAWVNNYAFTQEFKLFNIFSLPVLNLDFWTKGIPSLLRWDYSFFGGNAQLFQYLLYSLTAVVAFIIFGLLIGLLYNFFRGR